MLKLLGMRRNLRFLILKVALIFLAIDIDIDLIDLWNKLRSKQQRLIILFSNFFEKYILLFWEFEFTEFVMICLAVFGLQSIE